MYNKFPNLFSPLKIGPLTLRNRIAGAPMGFSDTLLNGDFCKENIAMYQAFAQGGAALVTVGETTVDTYTGQAHDRTTPLDNRDILPSLLECSDAIKQHGAIASIELIHPGHWANPKFTKGPIVYSASAGIHHRYGQIYEAVEMNEQDIERAVEAFAQAAYMGRVGGFDMCMIHGAHGWLISQFLSAEENRRTDRFGGSLENRARFPLLIIERIRKRCGADFPIEFRFSGKVSTDSAEEIQESIDFAKMLDGKVDLIHVSVSSFAKKDTVPRMFPTMFLPHGVNTDISAAIKKHVKTPVVTVGRLGYPELMEEIIATGQADVIAMVRGLMADPQLPRKAKESRDNEIVPCLRCNTCMSETFVSLLPYASRAMKCAVNPTCGREFQFRLWDKPRCAHRVLIAGGGPAGMQAAIVAAERGHEVILCEKTAALGGALNMHSHILFKKDLLKFKQSLINRLYNQKVTVMLNTEVTPQLIQILKPDDLIAALGARARIANIAGCQFPHVRTIEEMSAASEHMGNRVVIIGGGMSGTEEGLDLAMKGHEVLVLEQEDEIAADANFRGREALMQEISKYDNFQAKTNLKALEITEKSIHAVDSKGDIHTFMADSVILAVGRIALNEEAEILRSYAPEFVTVGDCRKAGKIIDATHDGFNAAMNIY
ncbi:MAG: FAD-dependent oxidoreductase [Firmicutes bacterium]|nr:FAD-dependent oxidoreductase [Bacillota bacterium]